MNQQTTAFQTIKTVDIEGTPTDIMFHAFGNKLFLVITQYQRISNIFIAYANTQNGITKNHTREIKHQFGTDTDEIQSAIRHLVANVPALTESSLDIIINFGLKDINRAVLQSLERTLVHIL